MSRETKIEMARFKESKLRLMPEYPPPYSRHETYRILECEDTSTVEENAEAVPRVTTTGGKNTRCRFTSYCIIGAFAVLLCTFSIGALFPYPIHASCTVKWKFNEPCTYVMQRLRSQVLKWNTCNGCGPRGSRCLYSLKEVKPSDNDIIRATHVTPNLKLVDKMKLTFENNFNNTCVATGESQSVSWFVVFDYGTNYCNLHNLVVGAGFDMDASFEELTSDAICTQFAMAVCR